MKLKKLPIIQLLIQSVLFLITAVPIMAQQNQYFGPKTHDLYAFRSPDDTNTVTIIATFSALQSPQDGLNYPSFDPNTRYEIHIENDGTAGDDITYRFKFNQTNQDPTTFFLVRLGQQNYATTYTLESSINNGPFTTIVNNGIVPAVNIGDRSVSDPTVGLGASNYNSLINSSITSTSGGGGETVFCGHADDPFFMDLGGFADLGSTGNGTGPSDGYGRKNVMAITLKIPISTLQKNGLPVTAAVNILDADFIIGLWSSTSVQEFRTLNTNGTQSNSGSWIQVSRVGMPLTNTLIIPVGFRDTWNSLTPYNENPISEDYISNPELGLYMDNSLFGGAFPNWSALRIQRNTL